MGNNTKSYSPEVARAKEYEGKTLKQLEEELRKWITRGEFSERNAAKHNEVYNEAIQEIVAGEVTYIRKLIADKIGRK